jgi:hypothetical protein
MTDRVKAHNEGTGLGATLGRLIVGMVNHLGELPLNTQVASRKLMAHAIKEESSREQFEAEWNKVLDLLVTLGGNENARHVYDTACKTAQHAIEKSIAEVSRWDAGAGSTYMAQKQPFLNILRSVELRMSEF